MYLIIRLEKESDYKKVENVTREAFWNKYKPGCDEHLVVHNIRKTNSFVKELDFVACNEEEVISNILYSKAKVVDDYNEEHEVLCMGPISVLPSYQRKGIGSLLMKHSIKAARMLGYSGIILYGNPNYYHRFGFEDAKKYGIKTARGDNFQEFMALELNEGSLDSINGKFYDDPAYNTEAGELEKFEKQFPYKDKRITRRQLSFSH